MRLSVSSLNVARRPKTDCSWRSGAFPPQSTLAGASQKTFGAKFDGRAGNTLPGYSHKRKKGPSDVADGPFRTEVQKC